MPTISGSTEMVTVAVKLLQSTEPPQYDISVFQFSSISVCKGIRRDDKYNGKVREELSRSASAGF